MKQYNEQKSLQKLDIADFSHITTDKIPILSSVLPYMEPEVAKKALDHLPDFKDFASELIGQYKDTVDKMIVENGKSETEFYQACNNIILSLQEELNRDDLEVSDRERIEIKMIYIAELIGKKDSESKNFKIIMGVTFALLVTALGGIAVAALASNATLKRKSNGYDIDGIPEVNIDDIPEVDIRDMPEVAIDDMPEVDIDDMLDLF